MLEIAWWNFRTSGSLEEVAKRELYEESGFIAKRLTLFNIFSGEEFYYGYPNGDEVYKFLLFRYDLQENINPPEVVIIKAFLESDLM